MNTPDIPAIVIIGAGPRGLSVLERLVSLASRRQVEATVHLIDPYPPGAGIVWRTDQPETLLMNTTISEQTIFPDASCTFLPPGTSPIGTDMATWHIARGGTDPVDSTFATRADYGRYLRDAYDRIRAAAPATLEIVEHRTKVESVIDLPTMDLLPDSAEPIDAQPDALTAPEQLVRCEDGTTIIASAVVLAVGHIPSAQSEERARLAAFAHRNGGVYIPQGLPAEAPIAEVLPASRVIVRGMGLNYYDLQTLFTYERGGRFVPLDDGGRLRYVPSGLEPHLLLGSRRGIPYRSKPISDAHPRTEAQLRFFTRENIADLAGIDTLDGDLKASARFNDQLWPLILADLRFAYYSVLSRTRPEAFSGDPGQLREAIVEAVSRHLTRRTWYETHPEAVRPKPGNVPPAVRPRSALRAAVASTEATRLGRVTREAMAWAEIEQELVPDVHDRMSLHELLNPLEGREFSGREHGDADSFHEWMLRFLRDDLATSLDGPEASPVKALFGVLWQVRILLKELVAAGHIDRVSFDMEVTGWFESFVSGICDGPPAQRIAELLALAEAGIVEFIGPDMRIEANEEPDTAEAGAGAAGVGEPGTAGEDTLPQIFTVTSAQVPGRLTASTVIDAASPTNAVDRAADVLIHGMMDRRQLTAARLTMHDGTQKRLNGLALTPRPYRTIDADGVVHPRRFVLSIQLSALQWGLAIAANPNANATTLADAHAAAEAILDLIADDPR